MAAIIDSVLYKAFTCRSSEIAASPVNLSDVFRDLSALIQDTERYIVLSFPEYTPHDHIRHIGGLFRLADRVLGEAVYSRLGNAELVLLAFGLCTHDWGMALPLADLQRLFTGEDDSSTGMLPGEPRSARDFVSKAVSDGLSERSAQSEYLRRTHAFRSGLRLRKYLEDTSPVFADAVAKIAEGHALDIRELRNQQRYPFASPVLGESVNIAALTTYARIIDLLDIGDDRTPYAFWKFVSPSNEVSKIEWRKHRALSPVAVQEVSGIRELLISGRADDPAIFSALADLRSWVDTQFTDSMAFLRTMPAKYHLMLDSRIRWSLEAVDFDPLLIRFECDRSSVLRLLSDELYTHDPLAFIRELLQNSVDAIDARAALLADTGLTLNGEIAIKVHSIGSSIQIEWRDNGIGMDSNVLSSYFASVGLSWYNSREAGKIPRLHPISQFGVGVLSIFAVSDYITIWTRKDPHASNAASGMAVEIPGRDMYFQIRPMLDAPIGTTVTLTLRTATAVISKESICSAIARVSRLVKHRVVIESDGVLIEAGASAYQSFPPLSLKAIRGESASVLTAACKYISFEIGKGSPRFEGQYSALIPRSPTDVHDPVGYNEWRIGKTAISFDDIVTDSEQVVFTKGIQVGPVTPQDRRREDGTYLGTRYTDWISPKIWLNVFDPGCMKFDLNRSVAHFTSKHLIDAVWTEIALALKNEICPGDLTDPAELATFLGTSALFGAVPDAGLRALVEPDRVPLLLLRCVGGTGWQFTKEFVRGGEFLEAPFELGYVADAAGSFETGAFSAWEGENALFPVDGFTMRKLPYAPYVVGFGQDMLMQSGWVPVAVRFAHPPANDSVPLVCRVWRKACQESILAGEPRNSLPWDVLRRVFRASPQLLEFPKASKEIAAIGSRYWNVEHPKIIAITQTLLKLSAKFHERKLSAEKARLFSYLTGDSFYGYTVPSRHAGFTLAIDTPNRLLDLAEGENFCCAQRLVKDDFYPGTVEGYWNPYHYDLGAWQTPGSHLGLAMH